MRSAGRKAARVIAIDRFPERLALARSIGATTVDYSEDDLSVLVALKDLTGGIGLDSCIDAVGLEAHSTELQGIYDVVKAALMLEQDRPSVLRQAIQAVRKGGIVSIPGVYGGLLEQGPVWRRFRQGRHHENGTDQHAQLHEAPSRSSGKRTDRSELCHFASYQP
jgi:threonine dehydrogenase-like Zn-dependent dehydrogenase